jgi:drug/metabolite transporter (DMT)-like permease
MPSPASPASPASADSAADDAIVAARAERLARHRRRVGVLMVTAAAASWGTWSLFLRPAALPAAFTAPLMFALMGLAALPLALRGPATRWDRRVLYLLLGNAACDALNVFTFFAAMDHTSVAVAVLTHYATPVIVALAAPWIDRERNPAAVAAAVLALAGLTLILEPWRSGSAGGGVGAALGLASAFCYAGNVFIVRRLATAIGVARAISYHSLIAAVLLLPMLLTVSFSAVTLRGLVLLTAGSLTIGAASGMLYASGLVRVGASRSGVLTFAEPLVAVLVGITVWGEPATLPMIAGGALVLAAGLWVIRGAAASAPASAPGEPPGVTPADPASPPQAPPRSENPR